jgi:hypothetical protein
MEPQTSLSPDQRANLVAYLDGELDEPAASAVERLLAESAAARQEAEMLSRTFDLLDELPLAAASKEFTARTLSAIKVSDIATTLRPAGRNVWSPSIHRWAVTGGVACVLAAAALVGYFSTNRWISDPSEALIRDLPVIENVDKYAEAEDIAFLRELERSELFNDSDRLPEF